MLLGFMQSIAKLEFALAGNLEIQFQLAIGNLLLAQAEKQHDQQQTREACDNQD